MQLAYRSPSSMQWRLPDRRRLIALGIAIVVHILIILLLLRLVPETPAAKVAPPRPVTFSMLPDAPVTKAATPHAATAKVKRPSGGAAPRTDQPPVPKPPAAQAPTPPVKPVNPVPTLFGDKSLFGAADIGAMPSHDGEGEGTAVAGKDSGSVYGPGEGPGGARLFNAEWYREPSHAELAGYLPHGAPPDSWTEIACQTVPRYHVENCRSLGESPIGSGLGRAMRQAAWQFLVRPPRVGGKTLVGAWVRIRISFTETGKKDQAGAGAGAGADQ